MLKLSLEDYSVLKELSNRLKLNESVLRFIIKQVDDLEENNPQNNSRKNTSKDFVAA